MASDPAAGSALPRHIDWQAAGDALRADGVVHLPRALDAAAFARMEQLVEANLADPGPSARRFYPNESATFLEAAGSEAFRDRYITAVRETGIRDMVAALWGQARGEPRMWYLGAQLFLKEGGHSRRTPWHQDTSYLRMRGDQLVAVWTCLDPLPKDHCLEFVRGSHRGELFNGSAFDARDDTAPLYKRSPLQRLPDIQANRAAYEILSWDVTPGDLIVFHLGVLHGGAGTAPGMRRRTVSLRFLGPDVVFDGRMRDYRDAQEGNDVALAGFYAGMKDGDPFRVSLLPAV
jgi:hypothetical protein